MSESAKQRLSSRIKGNKKNHEKKVKIEEGCFASEFFLCKHIISQSASCKMILLCCYNTAAEAFPKLCHVVREGERKQLLFPLSKMAEGRGKAAMSREEEWCSPSCSGEGWAIQRASFPSFSSPH